MSNLQNLISACGTDEKTLRAKTQSHIVDWERWMQPINENDPTGSDSGYDDDFQLMRDEVNKLTGTDTALICQLAEKLLTTTSKDLRVITFYVWARLHQDGETGLAEGLELLAGMLEKYGTRLHPLRERTRKSALEWLTSRKVMDSLLLYPEVDMAVMPRITGALLLVEQAIVQLDAPSRPELAPLYQGLNQRLEQSGGASSLVPQNSREENNSRPATRSSAPVMSSVSSGRDLLDQAKVLAAYLRDQPGGWLAGHHLIKSIRWDTLATLPPLDSAGRTRLVPPKPDNRAHLKRLYLQQSWNELLERADNLQAQGVNHLWLDVQWYIWQALLKMDNDTVRADIICRDLQGLLTRLPGLETLAFDDGTPFADEVTLSWINASVLGEGNNWKEEPVNAPDLSGDAVLALEAEAIQLADTEGVEAALNWLQLRPGFSSAKDRWMVRLLMARVAEQYNKNELALHLLSDLDNRASALTLDHWIPELMFEVKARWVRLLRAKAGRNEADKLRLQAEMDTLLSGLIALDPARAAVLCN